MEDITRMIISNMDAETRYRMYCFVPYYRKLIDEDESFKIIPYVTKEDNVQISYFNGLVHSYYGKPAMIFPNNAQMIWYRMGKIHRKDLPACITKLEYKEEYAFFKNDMLHRQNGPALIIKNPYNPSDITYHYVVMNRYIATVKNMDKKEIYETCRINNPTRVFRLYSDYCVIETFKDGLRHSYDDIPAYICRSLVFSQSIEIWFTNGVATRSTGPAYVNKFSILGHNYTVERNLFNGIYHKDEITYTTADNKSKLVRNRKIRGTLTFYRLQDKNDNITDEVIGGTSSRFMEFEQLELK